MKKATKYNVIIIAGLSGSGKTTIGNTLEDLGYQAFINFPSIYLEDAIKRYKGFNNEAKVAFILNSTSEIRYDILKQIYDDTSLNSKFIYVEAQKDIIIRRYKETRRTHPFLLKYSLEDAIKREEEKLGEFKELSDVIFDSSLTSVNEFKYKLINLLSDEKNKLTKITITSFGFKYAVPSEFDYMFDVRFIKNPYYIKELKAQTGLDKDVYDFVLESDVAKKFVKTIEELIILIEKEYKKVGKTTINIGIGCTGGQHRSVAIAEYLHKQLKTSYNAYIWHKDIEKRKMNA